MYLSYECMVYNTNTIFIWSHGAAEAELKALYLSSMSQFNDSHVIA